MKFITTCKNIAEKSTFLRIIMRKLLYSAKKIIYRLRGISLNADDHTVIFGAYNGKSYVCSPKAIYEYMISDEAFSDYQFVWMFKNPDNYRFLEKNKNTVLVKSGSSECEKYLHRAKYWIFNFRAMDQWIPSKKQVYVQCWHGTPLKRLGYDITNSDNAMNSVKEIQEKYRTDTERFSYLVSPCRFSSEKFASAWNLEKLGNQKALIETGYPRNDFLRNFTSADLLRVKKNLGITDNHKKIILYAPTWRDNQHDSEKGYVYKNPVDFNFLMKELGEEYIILFRAHYLVADNFDFDAYKGFIYNVSEYDDINDLYILSDLLITDYSSVFFDYAILERPILFYMYDMDEYRDEMRGFYLDIDELPGPVIQTEKELVQSVRVSSEKFDRDRMDRFNNRFNYLNDGSAAKRVVDIVFNRHSSEKKSER